ncbi:tetratricopeptide repeat protein [Luteimonas sp. FCS-9]|uniref:tetratricopeptide repeat protein n=1 Tax=Luteimonas sp. FCS-9 TaxID=1547516 RepID=UPI000699B08A|nr:tetratricopeptide repeat protein [Luteimonas sp. FCS-9]
MTTSPRFAALTYEQAARFREALQALSARRLDEALAIAHRLARDAPDAPDAHQVLAMCLAESQRPSEAEAAFARALALAPTSVPVLRNVATYLRRSDRSAEAVAYLRRAVACAPSDFQAWLQLGTAEMSLDRHEAAIAALTHATRLQPGSAPAWHALGNACRAQWRHDEAAAAYRAAIDAQPDYAPAWRSLGAVLRLSGRADEAVACFQHAAREPGTGPSLIDALSGALLDAGRTDDALRNARDLVRTHPTYVPGQSTFAHLLWEYGARLASVPDPIAAFSDAAGARRDDRDMQIAYLRFLLQAGQGEAAIDWIGRLGGPLAHDPAIDWLHADASALLGRHDDAQAHYERAYAGIGDRVPAFLNAYARHRLRTGQWRGAVDLAQRAIAAAPYDQDAWSNLGTAWRLLGDAREAWLFDYERMVGCLDIDPPDGHTDIGVFLAELAAELEPLHQASHAPVNQSLREGTQTPGNLFGRRLPAIAALQRRLLTAIEQWLSTLPEDPTHPFLSRRRRSIAFEGSWSVRLRQGGQHRNHIHSRGWMSSAFYVQVPPAPERAHGEDGESPGCLRLGQPLETLGLDLPPRRVVRPEPGRLVVFPSCMWHGTAPFDGETPRMTIAFDMLPRQ